MEIFDVAIVGGGPAGSVCAAFCAAAGLRTVVIEREKFPREKVCGDCLNPACWATLQRLQLAKRVRALPHGVLHRVEFIGISGRTLTVTLPSGDDSEIAIKRSLFDQLMMHRARELGATICEEKTVTALTSATAGTRNWTIAAADRTFESRVLVAADGRNSTVARLRGLLPRSEKERVALQTHLPMARDFGERVVLQFLPEGYSGQAPVGEGVLNVCLVGVPRLMPALRKWAEARFNISREHSWRTVTPLTRAPLPAVHDRLFLIGDAARVVEPFTGEGIYYALRSGELAAEAIAKMNHGQDERSAAREFARAHAAMYRGRLWINQVARAAVLSPRIASLFMRAARFQPALLRLLTAKIVQSL
jgi:menaquinone-9 beta-reductase